MEKAHTPSKTFAYFPNSTVAMTEPLGRCAVVLVRMQGENISLSIALWTLAAFSVS
jgi:hypothetical protein